MQTTHDFRYTSAYYPTTQMCYSVAVDQADGLNYILQYDYANFNKEPHLFPLKTYSEDPNAATYAGNPHQDSLIYYV